MKNRLIKTESYADIAYFRKKINIIVYLSREKIWIELLKYGNVHKITPASSPVI